MAGGYPVQLEIDYPDRALDRAYERVRTCCRSSSGHSRSRTIVVLAVLLTSASWRAPCSRGSRSSSRAATRAASSTTSPASCAGANRVAAYAFVLSTDDYPPFRLGA